MKPRKIMLATPVSTSSVNMLYAYSLAVSLKHIQGVDLYPVFLQGALLEDIRNRLLAMFWNSDCDEIVFLDSDIDWTPNALARLLSHEVQAVGASYRRKNDNEISFVVKTKDGKPPKREENGLMRVQGLGTGFLRLTREAVKTLWKKSKAYKSDGIEVRRICEVSIYNGELISEDISLCFKLPELWLDPEIVLGHTGERRFTGNVTDFFKAVDEIQKEKK